MNVIGLTGLSGSGKSTVANYLVRQHGYHRLSFSAPLKPLLRELNPMLGVSLAYGPRDPRPMRLSDVVLQATYQIDSGKFEGSIHDYIIQKTIHGREYRHLLETLRAHQPGYWVKFACEQMTNPEDGKYVFDDVTFPEEAQVILGIDKWGLWDVQRTTLEPGHNIGHTGSLGEWQTIFNIPDNWDHLERAVDMALDLAFGSEQELGNAA
jgi:hypothetical protein